MRDDKQEVLMSASEKEAYIFCRNFYEVREFKKVTSELKCTNSTMTYSMKKLPTLVRKCFREFGYLFVSTA